MGESRDPRSIGESIDRLATELDLGAVRLAAAVHSRWRPVAGQALAAHARPTRFRDGVLTVEVDGPAWATQVRFLGADLVRGLNEAAGVDAIREIRVVVRPPGTARRGFGADSGEPGDDR